MSYHCLEQTKDGIYLPKYVCGILYSYDYSLIRVEYGLISVIKKAISRFKTCLERNSAWFLSSYAPKLNSIFKISCENLKI
jgi:hypothetical protein